MREACKLIKVFCFLAGFLLFFTVYSQAQNSYIVVHALNPEDIEIASIDGMDQYCVQIYNSEILIGYGAYDAETYNKPIAISPGVHTIRVVFNGKTLEQIIDLQEAETKLLTFVFEREEFNLMQYLSSFNCHLISQISGTYSGIQQYTDDIKVFHNNWTTQVAHESINVDTNGSYSLYSELLFNLSGNDLEWRVKLDADKTNCFYNYPYPIYARWNSFVSMESITDQQDFYLQNYDKWILQYIDCSIQEDFYIKIGNMVLTEMGYHLGTFPEGKIPVYIENKKVSSVVLHSGDINVENTGKCWHHWGSYVKEGKGQIKVWLSSVPYDLTGTGIKNKEAVLIITGVTTDKNSYTIGEKAKMSCIVTDNYGVTVSGAFVIAEIIKPNSDAETVLFSEKQQERGGYEGVFDNVSLQGIYNATIKARKIGYLDANPINLTFTAERNKIPLGKSLSITDPDIEFYSIYIADRYGGELTVTATGGTIELYSPDPYTKVANVFTQINYQVPFNQFGWHYVKIIDRGSISNISNTFVQTGEASYRPWNFWYWPLKKSDDNPQLNLYGEGGALAKYDTLFGTQARSYEEYWWGGYVNRRTGIEWDSGDGHCWGASIASILLPQPKDIVYHSLSNDEMEGLVSELADTKAICEKIVSDVPPIKPRPGRDEADKFISKIHVGLVAHLLLNENQNNRPLQSNLRDFNGNNPNAIWNHAIYKFESNMKESEDGKEEIIEISTILYSNCDFFPPPTDNTTARIDTYVYKLGYTVEGEISRDFTDQDWISATGFALDNLWYVKKSSFNNSANLKLTKENVNKIGINLPE